MNEIQIKTIFGLVADPENNVVNTDERYWNEEIGRIVRVFNLSKEQDNFSNVKLKNLTAFQLSCCNN